MSDRQFTRGVIRIHIDSGKDPHCPATVEARLDVDLEYAFQTLRPSHRSAGYPGVRYLTNVK
jgi:hypothetical protein